MMKRFKKGDTMGRNREKNEQDKAARREQILRDSFRFFAEKTIESPSMNEVADACGVGIATVYRYFPTKSALVLAVNSWVWENYTRGAYAGRNTEDTAAAEDYASFLESFLDLYRNHRDVLRFNQFFNVYVRREGIGPGQLAAYTTLIRDLEERFCRLYRKGLADGTLRADVPETEMFAATLHLMLAAATRYAVGLLYTNGGEPEQELRLLKKMLLREYTVENRAGT